MHHDESWWSLNRTFRVEDDYKLLVKFVRLWQKAIIRIKHKRVDRKYML